MGVKYKVIGFVFGGKDLCFNFMYCVVNGYEIVVFVMLIFEFGIGEFFFFF